MAGGVHRLGDANSPHPCPPFWPSGYGFPSCSIMGTPTVLVNGQPATVASNVTCPHPCTDWDDWGWHIGVYVFQRKVLAEGMPIQAMFDMNCCKAVLVTGSDTVIVGE